MKKFLLLFIFLFFFFIIPSRVHAVDSNLLSTVGVGYLPEKLWYSDASGNSKPGKVDMYYPTPIFQETSDNFFNFNFNPNLISTDTRNVQIGFFLSGNPKDAKRGKFAVCLRSTREECLLLPDNLIEVGDHNGDYSANPEIGISDTSSHTKTMDMFRQHQYPDVSKDNVIFINVCGNGDNELKTDCDWDNNRRSVWFHPESVYRVGLYQKPDGQKGWSFVGEAQFLAHRTFPNVFLSFNGAINDQDVNLVGESIDPRFDGKKLIGGTITTDGTNSHYIALNEIYPTFKCLSPDQTIGTDLKDCTPLQIYRKEGVIVKEIPLTASSPGFRVDTTLTGRVIPMSVKNQGNYDANDHDKKFQADDNKSDDENDFQISLETTKGTELPANIKDQCVITRGDVWDIKYKDIYPYLYRFKPRDINNFETGLGSDSYILPDKVPETKNRSQNILDSLPAIYQGLGPGDYTIEISEQDGEKHDSCADSFTYWQIPFHIKRVNGDKTKSDILRLIIYQDEIQKDPAGIDYLTQNIDAGNVKDPCAQYDQGKDQDVGTGSFWKLPNPFGKASTENKGDCLSVKTALGDISVKPVGFVKDLFSLILGIAAIGAIFMLIYSGYRFLTSQGDKQKIAGARETITSTIIGLLFIIFSLVILQFIGVDILQIPGFH